MLAFASLRQGTQVRPCNASYPSRCNASHASPATQALLASPARPAVGKSQYWKDDGSSLGAGLAGDAEMYPYVSLTLSVDYNA